MSLEIKDIEHLASLSRISLSEEEKQAFLNDFTSILGYVSELTSVTDSASEIKYSQTNVAREDNPTHAAHTHTEAVLNVAPQRNGDYVQVDQVF